jgi:hypothetical protein
VVGGEGVPIREVAEIFAAHGHPPATRTACRLPSPGWAKVIARQAQVVTDCLAGLSSQVRRRETQVRSGQ